MNQGDSNSDVPTTNVADIEEKIKKITDLYSATRTARENWIKIARLSFITHIAREAINNPTPSVDDTLIQPHQQQGFVDTGNRAGRDQMLRMAQLAALNRPGVLQDKRETAEKNKRVGDEIQLLLTEKYAEEVRSWAEEKKKQAMHLQFTSSTKDDRDVARVGTASANELVEDMMIAISDAAYAFGRKPIALYDPDDKKRTGLDPTAAAQLNSNVEELQQWLQAPENRCESLLQKFQQFMEHKNGVPLETFQPAEQEKIVTWAQSLQRLNENPTAEWNEITETWKAAELTFTDLARLKGNQGVWLDRVELLRSVETQWSHTVQKQENALASMAPDEKESWWNDHIAAIKLSVEDFFHLDRVEENVKEAVRAQELQKISSEEIDKLRTTLVTEEATRVRQHYQQQAEAFGDTIDIGEQVDFEMNRPNRIAQRRLQVRQLMATPASQRSISNKLVARMAESTVKEEIEEKIKAQKLSTQHLIHAKVQELMPGVAQAISSHQPPLTHLNQLWQRYAPLIEQEATIALQQIFEQNDAAIKGKMREAAREQTGNASGKKNIPPQLHEFLEPLAQKIGTTVAEYELISPGNRASGYSFSAVVLMGKREDGISPPTIYLLDQKHKSVLAVTRSILGNSQWESLEKELNNDKRSLTKLLNLYIPKSEEHGRGHSPGR